MSSNGIPPDPFEKHGMSPDMWAAQLCVDAQAIASNLATAPRLHLGDAATYMRAFTSLVNVIYDRREDATLLENTRGASTAAADVSLGYILSIGLGDDLEQERREVSQSSGGSEIADLRAVVNYTYQHVIPAADQETERAREAGWYSDDPQSQEEIIAEQRSSRVPYDERLLRGVIGQFGDSFAPIALAIVSRAPSDDEARQLLRIATMNIQELLPPPADPAF